MSATEEIDQGTRFSFGRNWASFLKTVDSSRIDIAMESVRELLQVSDLHEASFLDVGCGSGLLSLAARKLGARVRSFDFDPESVACAKELRERYDDIPGQWEIEQGSALDQDYLKSLGQFDVVYSWGVLHHTGQLWQALENVTHLVRPGGRLAIALYNDQGWQSRMWHTVKRLYCANTLSRWLVLGLFIPWFFVRATLVSVIRRQNEFATYRRKRGMSIVHDWIDWLGGLPFEVARFQDVQAFYEQRGFRLIHSKRTHRLGCNEFCFEQISLPSKS